jgi:hypothetical protein
MTKTRTAAFVALALSACSSDEPPGTTIPKEATLPATSALASMPNVSLIRVADGFVLAGHDDGTIRWGKLSLEGELTDEASFDLAGVVSSVQPVFAVTQKRVPGDQLLAITIADSKTKSGAYDLVAVTQTVGDADPSGPVVIAPLTDVSNLATVQLAAGAAITGTVGYVAWGIKDQGLHIPLNFALLAADATVKGALSKALDRSNPSQVPLWDCLGHHQGKTGLGFSVISPNGSNSYWHAIELSESGDVAEMTYPLDARVTSCQIMGTPKNPYGYVMAFQADTAIDLARYETRLDSDGGPTGEGEVTTSKSVIPSAIFGGPLNLPPLAWVSPVGRDIIVGLARPSGPQVFRFTNSGVPHGGTVTLRSANGRTGPVAAYASADAVYVTYTDQVTQAGSQSTHRYFMRVESPTDLP